MSLVQGIITWLGLGRSSDASVDEAMRRRVMMLAWPAMLQGLLLTSIQVVDTYLVSLLSDAALAAVGTASQLIFIMLILLLAIEVGASVLVAQAVGARDTERAGAVARQAVSFGLLLSIPIVGLGFGLRRQLVGVFGLEPEVESLALEYWTIVSMSLVLLMLVFVLSGILRGSGDTRTPMLATALANVVNAVGAYILIFGKLGFPEMGVAGSAVGSTLGWSAQVVFMAVMASRGTRPFKLLGRAGWRPQWINVREIIRIGGPTAGEEASFSLGFALLTGIVASLGTVALAAHRIAFNALSLSFMPGLGLAMAATALVGQAVGARDPAGGRRAMVIGAQYATLWMSLIGVGYFVFAGPLVGLFTDDPAVIGSGSSAMRALAFSQPFWALMLVFSGSLRGAGKSVYPMVVNSAMLWIGVGLSVIVSSLGYGLGMIWLMFAVAAPMPIYMLWRRLGREPLLDPARAGTLEPYGPGRPRLIEQLDTGPEPVKATVSD